MIYLKQISQTDFGIFTDLPIQVDERVLLCNGSLSYDRKDSFEKYLLQVGIQPSTGQGLYLVPDSCFKSGIELEHWKYINHSCKPNLKVVITGSLNRRNSVELIAIREILPNEELTIDYSTTQTESWQMICLCSSKKCRDVIGPVYTLPWWTKIKYLSLGMLPRYTYHALFSRGTK